MKKSLVTKVIAGLAFSTIMFACSPSTGSNPASGNTPASGTPAATAPAKLGTPSNAKLQSFSSDTFKLTFKLPADMTVKTNSADLFEADNNAMTFQLFPWKDAKASETDVLNAGLKGLNNIDKDSFKLDTDNSGAVTNLGGYNGFAVFGTAKQSGTDIYVGMLGLIDPNSADNYISYLTLDKNKNTSEDNKNLNVGADIFLSFARK